MSKKLTLIFLALAGIFVDTAKGQVSFQNSNNALGFGASYSGVAIAVVDMNADGLDDIVHLDNGRLLTIEYQKADGTGFNTLAVGSVSTMSQWSMCVADVDNNGYNDVMTGGRYDGIKVYKASAYGNSYTQTILPGAGLFAQGSNLADINNDGWMDAFVCHDDGESRIWGNDGTGQLLQADEWIDMATVPASDNSGNYGSVWTDFDNDGDIDLYIAKCRQGVNSPTDPRRINALFVNDGTGHYTEDALTYGLKIGAQSWTADFGDTDNDGDMDCFITNHDVPSMFLINDGAGHFTDATTGSGINVTGLPLQGVFRDFDNDGFIDIVVAGTAHHLFHNNGDNTFTEVSDIFDNNAMESFAIGDLNNDGRLDIYGGYSQVYTTPSNIPDAIWLNNTQNDNHYLGVILVGVNSNKNGAGARITAYGAWGQQIREVRSGESYGIMNSFRQHFGLGTATTIDSLVIKWPGGEIDTYYDIEADQNITLIEGACVAPVIDIEVAGETTFCPGESATLSVPEGYTYQWSNGATGNSIIVSESGSYNVIVSDGTGCYSVATPVDIVVDPQIAPVIIAASDTVFCVGGSVVLQSNLQAAGYTWSTGETTSSITVSASGDYTLVAQGLCSEFESPAIHVEVLPSPAPEVVGDTVYNEPGAATLVALGDNPHWYDAPAGGQLVFVGDTLEIPVLSETITYYVEDPQFYEGPVYFGGAPAHTGNSPFSGNQFNGALIFDVTTPFTLQSVKVYTDTPGPRVIELHNEAGDLLQSDTITIEMGESTIPLNFDVPAETGLTITTNTAFNNTNFGYNSPRLRRTNGATVAYPYVLPDVLSINGSTLGQDVYYYFYNWEIKLPDQTCNSERVAVSGIFEVIIDTEDQSNLALPISVFPNPTSDQLSIKIPEVAGSGLLTLSNVVGETLQTQLVESGLQHLTWSLGHLPKGMYQIQFTSAENRYTAKVVVE